MHERCGICVCRLGRANGTAGRPKHQGGPAVHSAFGLFSRCRRTGTCHRQIPVRHPEEPVPNKLLLLATGHNAEPPTSLPSICLYHSPSTQLVPFMGCLWGSVSLPAWRTHGGTLVACTVLWTATSSNKGRHGYSCMGTWYGYGETLLIPPPSARVW